MGVPGRSPRTLATSWGPLHRQDAQARPPGAVAATAAEFLIFYRQKRDCKSFGEQRERQGSGGWCGASSWAAPETSPPKSSAGSSERPAAPRGWARPKIPQKRREAGIVPHVLAAPVREKERFFNYCGLERALVEVLGAERFSPQSWAQAAPSPERRRRRAPETPATGRQQGRRRSPGHCGGQQLRGSGLRPRMGRPQVSVVERNARVIQWLYGCQRPRATAPVRGVTAAARGPALLGWGQGEGQGAGAGLDPGRAGLPASRVECFGAGPSLWIRGVHSPNLRSLGPKGPVGPSQAQTQDGENDLAALWRQEASEDWGGEIREPAE